jgi:hypothetical protein
MVQTHYLAAANLDAKPPTLKFYRINIKAKATNKNAEFQSGYYDANALRSLFSEVTKDASGTGQKDARPGTYNMTFKDGKWQKVNQESLFTVYFGADASKMAGQVSAFADAEATGRDFGRLFGAAVLGDKYLKIEEVNSAAVDRDLKLKALAAGLREISADLKQNNPQGDALSEKILTATLLIANVLGPNVGLPAIPQQADVAALTEYFNKIVAALVAGNK